MRACVCGEFASGRGYGGKDTRAARHCKRSARAAIRRAYTAARSRKARRVPALCAVRALPRAQADSPCRAAPSWLRHAVRGSRAAMLFRFHYNIINETEKFKSADAVLMQLFADFHFL